MHQLNSVLQSRYQLKQLLSQKAGHETWLSKDLQTHDLVVLKLLTCSDQVEWHNLQLFEREANVLQHLSHPRIPKYRDYFCIDDRLLWFGLVQNYIPGSSLKQLLEQGKSLSETQVRQVATNVLHVLMYLHELSPPVLHRDIKPSNLVWGEDNYIYLVDFGAVQARSTPEGATFTVVGTYGYVPLEQLGGRAVPASDLYSLGATLIHLLTRMTPADLQETRTQFADVVKLNPGFTRWIEQLTEPNLNRRFHSARQALDALKAHERAITLPFSPRPKDSRIELQKSPNHLAIAIPGVHPGKSALILLGLVLLVGLVLIYGKDVSPVTPISQAASITVGILFLIGSCLTGLPKLATTRLRFTHQHFTIESRLFGLCLKHYRGRISEIDRTFVSRNFFSGTAQGSPDLTLSMGVEEYRLSTYGRTLTEAEYSWLVSAMNQWLGLDEEFSKKLSGA